MRIWRWLTWGVLGLSACTLPTESKGGACTRSTECAPGLACVQGKCSDNLAAIAKQSQVPSLMPDQPGSGNDGG